METPCHSHIRTFLTRWSNRRAFLCLRKKGKAAEEAVTHSRGRRPFTARHGFFPGLAALQTQKLHPHHQLWNLQQVYSQWTSPVTSLNHFFFWPLQDHPVSSATVQSPLYNKALLFVLNLAISASPPIPCYENGDSSALPCSPSLYHRWFYRALSPCQVFASWRVLNDSDLAPAQPVHSSSHLPLLPWPVLPWALTAECLKLCRAQRGLHQATALSLGCLQFLSYHCICAERIFLRTLSTLPPASLPKWQYLI